MVISIFTNMVQSYTINPTCCYARIQDGNADNCDKYANKV